MIRADRIKKAYAGMKPEELAAIGFQFLCDANETELNVVRGAVPWRSYKALDYDFRCRFDALFNLGSYWAIQYWKTQAQLMACLGQSTKNLRDDNIDAAERALDAVRTHRRQLVTLVRAMETVAAEFGLEPGVFWRFADATPPADGYFEGTEVDAEWLDEVTSFLRAIVSEDASPSVVEKLKGQIAADEAAKRGNA